MYATIMRNITFSADEQLIDRARLRARREGKTLNAVFREWLQRYAGNSAAAAEYRQLMRRLSHVKADRKFTRDEMNSR
ncbi:MAG: hypothetical protein WBL65_07700 [Bryobacteraceae bacterium]